MTKSKSYFTTEPGRAGPEQTPDEDRGGTPRLLFWQWEWRCVR